MNLFDTDIKNRVPKIGTAKNEPSAISAMSYIESASPPSQKMYSLSVELARACLTKLKIAKSENNDLKN
jgi:hypothetical protein